jgi:hypothetical protein
VREDAPAGAETGRGLMLVAALSSHWGYYHTLGGKAVYFTLAFEPELAGDGRWCPQEGSARHKAAQG